MKSFRFLVKAFALVCFISPIQKVYSKNWHQIDAKRSNGFAIYRSGSPSRRGDFKKYCDYKVKEMMVLSGNADEYELSPKNPCKIKVVYNEEQSTKTPLSRTFLKKFDRWVENAQKNGHAIAFRCSCGCHRTGRLAAYYEMKYKGYSLRKAHAHLKKYGKFMRFFPQIFKQTTALNDYIKGRPCSTDRRYCVIED